MLDFTSSFDEQEPIERSGAEAALPVSDTELLDAYLHAVISVADAVGPAVLRVETRGVNGGGLGNDGGYSNKAVDDDIEAMAVELDPKKRQALIDDAALIALIYLILI